MNKKYIKKIIDYCWEDEYRHFQEVTGFNLSLFRTNDKDEVEWLINEIEKEKYDHYIFYTLLNLKLIIL